MIITPHLILGAAIGTKTQNLGLIIILGFLSHFILDKIPHWDYGNKAIKRFAESNSYKTLFTFFFKMMVDGLIGLLIVLFIVWQKDMINLNYLPFILIAIFVSLLPDFILGTVKLFYNKFPKFSKAYVDFHYKNLHHPKKITKPTLLGLGTEILISSIAILIMIL